MTSPHRHITVIPGDGIGQEVVGAALMLLKAVSAPITPVFCQAGESVFNQGISSGVPDATIDTIHQYPIVLKGPLTTPVGYGNRSANVFLRKTFGLFANIRPVKQYPNIPSRFKDTPIDLVVIRENIEDLYAGIEYYHQPSVAQSIKLVSQLGCDCINTFAFEYANQTNRSSIHCATKANILKNTEGLMKRSFETIATQYPHIQPHHIIIDNCAHQLVMNPSQFNMIVTTNMNGDIISDLTSGLVGGLGIAPSANIGKHVAMFEAVHGAAPDIAEQNMANPTAIILSTIMMLRYMGFSNEADTLEHALAVTFEHHQFTRDLCPNNGLSTTEFTQAIINNLGKTATNGFVPSSFSPITLPDIAIQPTIPSHCYGLDVVIVSDESFSTIQSTLNNIANAQDFNPVILSNRGKVITHEADDLLIPQWFCRFETAGKSPVNHHHIDRLLTAIHPHFEWVQIEKLMKWPNTD